MKWIRCGQELPQRWAFKRDIPEQWRRWGIKVEFAFDVAWIARDINGRVLMPSGRWADVFDFHLHTPGHVIGLRDLTTADAYAWRHEWRAAMDDRIRERMAAQ